MCSARFQFPYSTCQGIFGARARYPVSKVTRPQLVRSPHSSSLSSRRHQDLLCTYNCTHDQEVSLISKHIFLLPAARCDIHGPGQVAQLLEHPPAIHQGCGFHPLSGNIQESTTSPGRLGQLAGALPHVPKGCPLDSWLKGKVFLGSAEEEMPISHKIRQYIALLGFVHPGEVPPSAEQAGEVASKQGIWRGFTHQILLGSPRGLGIGLLEQSGNLSLVVPWFDVSCLFRVVIRLPFCPTPPILTLVRAHSLRIRSPVRVRMGGNQSMTVSLSQVS